MEDQRSLPNRIQHAQLVLEGTQTQKLIYDDKLSCDWVRVGWRGWVRGRMGGVHYHVAWI